MISGRVLQVEIEIHNYSSPSFSSSPSSSSSSPSSPPPPHHVVVIIPPLKKKKTRDPSGGLSEKEMADGAAVGHIAEACRNIKHKMSDWYDFNLSTLVRLLKVSLNRFTDLLTSFGSVFKFIFTKLLFLIRCPTPTFTSL